MNRERRHSQADSNLSNPNQARNLQSPSMQAAMFLQNKSPKLSARALLALASPADQKG